MAKQGDGAKDVVKIVKVAVPNNWPTVRPIDQIDQLGKFAAKYRAKAGLSNGVTVAYGSKSSTYRSKGSTGKSETDATVRDITVAGKKLSWQVYPMQAATEDLYPYFMVIDLYQNYVKVGGSTSGIMIDAIMLTLSDVDMVHDIMVKLAGVSEAEFAAYVKFCETLREYWQVTTGQAMLCEPSNFDTTVGDGSVTPAATNGEKKAATDLTTISWD